MSPHASTAPPGPSLGRLRHLVYVVVVTASLAILLGSALVASVVGWAGVIGQCW